MKSLKEFAGTLIGMGDAIRLYLGTDIVSNKLMSRIKSRISDEIKRGGITAVKANNRYLISEKSFRHFIVRDRSAYPDVLSDHRVKANRKQKK